MTQFITVKVEELSGPALDWAIAQVEKVKVTVNGSFSYKVFIGCKKGLIKALYNPSTDWATGGPLIEKYRVGTYCDYTEQETITANVTGSGAVVTGSTFLIAACRAIVAAQFGESMSVPTELLP